MCSICLLLSVKRAAGGSSVQKLTTTPLFFIPPLLLFFVLFHWPVLVCISALIVRVSSPAGPLGCAICSHVPLPRMAGDPRDVKRAEDGPGQRARVLAEDQSIRAGSQAALFRLHEVYFGRWYEGWCARDDARCITLIRLFPTSASADEQQPTNKLLLSFSFTTLVYFFLFFHFFRKQIIPVLIIFFSFVVVVGAFISHFE